jgi:hypothetical protein
MSRSRRKTPVFGNTTATSEKADKRIANQRLRSHVRTSFAAGQEPAIGIRDVSSTWTFDKDGKRFWCGATAEDMRK